MKHLFARLLLMLTVLVVLGDGSARADTVNFSYTWTTLPQAVFPGLGSSTGSVAIAAASPGTGSVTVGDPVGIFISTATVTTSSTATDPADSYGSNFSMKLNLTDTASGKSGVLNFTGSLSGTLTSTKASLTGTFDDPLTKTLTLGTHIYSAEIDALFHPQPPGSQAQVQFYTEITVADASTGTGTGTGTGGNSGDKGNGSPSSTPEPSSLVLGATALCGLALRRLARRGRRA